MIANILHIPANHYSFQDGVNNYAKIPSIFFNKNPFESTIYEKIITFLNVNNK